MSFGSRVRILQFAFVLGLLTLSPGARADEVEATSFLGEPLLRPELPEEFAAKQGGLLDEAQGALDADPSDLEAAIWVGRRLAYLGRYRDSIDHYTRALEQHPDNPKLLRHRGHRWITVRQLDRAIEDLSRASALTRGTEDEVEPDGLPNERGIPTSTLQSNIEYHLGLAHYLAGDFGDALEAYQRCLGVAKNPDNLVATTYWLYLTLARLGRAEEAKDVLTPITADLEVIENHDYYRLLLSYKGEESLDDLYAKARGEGASVSSGTVLYGLAAPHLVDGSSDRARTLLEEIVASPVWAAFGYIAAEAELARARPN